MSDPKDASPLKKLESLASSTIDRIDDGIKKATYASALIEQGQEPLPETLGHKGIHWKQSKGVLPSQGRSDEDVYNVLQDLIVFQPSENDEEEPEVAVGLETISSITRLSLVSHTTAAFCTTLEPPHFEKIYKLLHSETTRWITHLFRFYESEALYYDDPIEGLVQIARLALQLRYPQYLVQGFHCFQKNTPAFYVSTTYDLGHIMLKRVCQRLGLPILTIRLVPSQLLNIEVLSKMIEKDLSEKRMPVMVIAEAGTYVDGFTDDILQVQEICKKHDIWLHVTGHCLATIAMINDPNVPTRVADSVTLDLGVWLGMTNLPTITLFKQDKLSAILEPEPSNRLVVLPLWVTLQALGRDNIQNRIKSCFSAIELLWSSLSAIPNVRLLSKKPGGTSGSLTVEHIIAKPLTIQFVPDAKSEEENPSYYDKLNNWMGQILLRDLPQYPIQFCNIKKKGLAVRMCPIEYVLTLNENDVEIIVNHLHQQLEILRATVTLKTVFQEKIKDYAQLEIAELPNWAGLGGVRYLPLRDEDNLLTDDELNKLNVEIVSSLRATDSAFSLGEDKNGKVCVRFGMVAPETEIDELLSLINEIGSRIEETSKNFDTMTEIVKKGIETATLGLQKESEERIWQDGILRQVPVFGSLVNWWSPKTTETGVKGRSLNLQAGVVESTENIYRYHMQLQQGVPAQPGTKSPPQPLVQTPIVTTGHSRSSSHASHTSNKSNNSSNQINEVNVNEN